MAHQRRKLVERREDLGLTQEEAARAAGISDRTYKRYESGETNPLVVHRPRLAKALQWTPAELRIALSDDGSIPVPNGQQVPKALTIFASLEQGASELWAWEPITVHGLLQTADYARAVERGEVVPRTDEGVARRVEHRMARQRVLTRGPDPLQLSVVLDESILHRVTGDRDVMTEQLDHLADTAELENVEVRVLPLDAGQHSAGAGSFQLLTSPGSAAPYTVCVEDRTGVRYLEAEPVVDLYVQVFEHLCACSLTPEESVDLIRRVAKEARP